MFQTPAALSLSLLTFLTAVPAFAMQAEPVAEQNDYSGKLTGGWDGARGNLANAGIFIDSVYKLDVVGNASGGIKQGVRGLDNLDVIFSLDGEKIAGVKGLSATIHLLNNFGGHPDADLVGSAQGINNIEVPRATGKLYQAFIEQNPFNDHFSILAGLYDLNSEFYVTDSSALFIHSTFGIGTEIAQSGQNGPSIFPFTSVGSRIRVNPTQETYIQAVILDGVSGDISHLKGTHIDFNKNDGWLVVAETGYAPQGAKLAVGGWVYTRKFDHQILAGAKERSQGAYIIGEKQLYAESKDQGLTAFARFGIANGEVNQFDYAWSTGFVYTGLFPGRDESQLGFGVTGAHNSRSFRQAAIIATMPVERAETTFELTYSDKITPWLSVQPDLQYVVNPGTDKALDNALVPGVRFTVNF